MSEFVVNPAVNRYLFLLAAILMSGSILLAGQNPAESILYISLPDSNEMLVADANRLPADRPCLVIATHGWYEKTAWPKDLAMVVKGKVDKKKWLCGWYDWRSEAKVINPIDATKFGRDKAGPLLGEKIVQLSKDFRHIHLIGHSAGAWVISEAAKIITEQTNATIHLTFLDAYVPTFWKEDELGDFNDPNVVYWADHYFTRDITLGVTEKKLTNAHNVNLTHVDPGINDHEFPRYWYHATVISQYAVGQRYEGKKLFAHLDDIEYGFARALEAGEENFRVSASLKLGNEAAEIRPPKKSIELQLKELLEKKEK